MHRGDQQIEERDFGRIKARKTECNDALGSAEANNHFFKEQAGEEAFGHGELGEQIQQFAH